MEPQNAFLRVLLGREEYRERAAFALLRRIYRFFNIYNNE